MNLPADMPSDTPDTDFASTVQLQREESGEVRALVVGDLGDPSYRIDSFSESLDLMRRVENSDQAVTLVLMDTRPSPPLTLQAFEARITRVDGDAQTMEVDLPIGCEPVGKGLTLRGSARLQGVLITFESETLSSHDAPTGAHRVLRARLPFRLYRLQRRDSFRVPVPASAGVFVTLRTGVRFLENLKAIDLSCGGVSLLIRAPIDAVHLGKRFPRAFFRLGLLGIEETYQVDMLVRHVRMAPPELNQMAKSLPDARPPHLITGNDKFRQTALAAVGALAPQELLQLGIEFERMPASLERNLARLVNELGVSLLTRVRSDD